MKLRMNTMPHFPWIAVCAMLLMSVTGASLEVMASGHGKMIHQPVIQAAEGQPIVIESSFTVPVSQVSVFYRFPGDPAYVETPMTERYNGNFSLVLSHIRLNKGQQFEYYLRALTSQGEELTYPEYNAEYSPVQVIGVAGTMIQNLGIEAVILSPEPDQSVSRDDFMVAVSLFSEEEIDIKNIRLRLDGDDVSRKSDITAELVTYSTRDVRDGSHTARVEYLTAGNEIVKLAEWNFSVVKQGGEDIFSGKGFTNVVSGSQAVQKIKFDEDRFRANFRTEFKGQNNLGEKTNYGRVGADLSYEKTWFKLSGSFDFDSQDDPRKNQPLNRYLVSANLDNVLVIDYGDTYPVFSPVTLYGTRVRGISAGVFLGIFNLQFVKGEVNRKVLSKKEENLLEWVDSIYTANSYKPDSAIVSEMNMTSGQYYNQFISGAMFRRDMTAGRFSVGPRALQIGFSFVKSKDNVGSMDYNEAKSLIFSGVKPKENLVVGTDFNIEMFSRKVRFDGSFAGGITNEDITGGNIDPQVFDDYGFGDISRTVKDLKKFITVNTNLNPIPVDSWQDINLYAYTFGGAFNHWDNNLMARYRYHGGYFQSFGSSIQRDIKSFEISDRYRFWENRAFASVSYQTTENNLAKRNVNTLTTSNLGFQLALFLPKDLPTLTFGFNTITRDNGWKDSSASWTADTTAGFYEQITNNARPEENRTNIFSFGTSYTFFMFDVRHNASLNIATSLKDDKTKNIDPILIPNSTTSFSYTALGNSSSNNIALSLGTEWKIPLRTSVSFALNTGKTNSLGLDSTSTGADTTVIRKTKPSASSFNLAADYMALREKDFRLNIYGGFGITTFDYPGLDKMTLTSFNVGQRFNFYVRHNIMLDFQMTAGLKIPKYDAAGLPDGSKSVVNRVISARYEFVF